MYIKKFYNKKKHDYENNLKEYYANKNFFESTEKRKKRNRIITLVFLSVLFLFITIVCFSSQGISSLQVAGFVFSILVLICVAAVIITIKKKVEYKQAPPVSEPFPDTHGLFIEMNSGYSVVFTAVDNLGRESLRQLRDRINDADVLQTSTVFNMVENHVNVESNEGIISLGDNSNNLMMRGQENEHSY